MSDDKEMRQFRASLIAFLEGDQKTSVVGTDHKEIERKVIFALSHPDVISALKKKGIPAVGLERDIRFNDLFQKVSQGMDVEAFTNAYVQRFSDWKDWYKDDAKTDTDANLYVIHKTIKTLSENGIKTIAYDNRFNSLDERSAIVGNREALIAQLEKDRENSSSIFSALREHGRTVLGGVFTNRADAKAQSLYRKDLKEASFPSYEAYMRATKPFHDREDRNIESQSSLFPEGQPRVLFAGRGHIQSACGLAEKMKEGRTDVKTLSIIKESGADAASAYIKAEGLKGNAVPDYVINTEDNKLTNSKGEKIPKSKPDSKMFSPQVCS